MLDFLKDKLKKQEEQIAKLQQKLEEEKFFREVDIRRCELIDSALVEKFCNCHSVFKQEGYKSHQVQCAYRILREGIEAKLYEGCISLGGSA